MKEPTPPKDGPACVLASGGMDSTVLMWWLRVHGVQVTPLFVNYGQHCAGEELATLLRVAPPDARGRLEVIDLSTLYQHSPSGLIRPRDLWTEEMSPEKLHLPGRNVVIAAAAIARTEELGQMRLMAAFIQSNVTPHGDRSLSTLASLQALAHGECANRVCYTVP